LSKNNFIQVFEYQKLRYNGDFKGFEEHHFDAMVKFNERNNNKYFDIIHKGVRFKSFVGVIQIAGLTIEILPKADKYEQASKDLWQSVLLNMLRVCKHIKIDNVSETSLKKRYNSILDVYFEMYLNEIEELVKKGLIKKYRRLQHNQLALKGKLVFSKNIQYNLVHKERFYCENQIYDKEHLHHHILLKGLKVLDSLINHNLRDKLNRLLFEFDNIKEINITSNHFEQITINRKTTPYRRAIDIAKMLILNYSPNLSSGSDNMLTLLFDMNKLWEEYIYRILQKHKPEGHSISFQNSTNFWNEKTIRPDIVIINKEKEIFIIDTKWKIVENNNPSDDDLKQMFTYNLHWKAEKSLLLYPRTVQKDLDYGNYHFQPMHKDDNNEIIILKNKCRLGFVSVVQSKSLRESSIIAEEVFMKLNTF